MSLALRQAFLRLVQQCVCSTKQLMVANTAIRVCTPAGKALVETLPRAPCVLEQTAPVRDQLLAPQALAQWRDADSRQVDCKIDTRAAMVRQFGLLEACKCPFPNLWAALIKLCPGCRRLQTRRRCERLA